MVVASFVCMHVCMYDCVHSVLSMLYVCMRMQDVRSMFERGVVLLLIGSSRCSGRTTRRPVSDGRHDRRCKANNTREKKEGRKGRKYFVLRTMCVEGGEGAMRCNDWATVREGAVRCAWGERTKERRRRRVNASRCTQTHINHTHKTKHIKHCRKRHTESHTTRIRTRKILGL